MESQSLKSNADQQTHIFQQLNQGLLFHVTFNPDDLQNISVRQDDALDNYTYILANVLKCTTGASDLDPDMVWIKVLLRQSSGLLRERGTEHEKLVVA